MHYATSPDSTDTPQSPISVKHGRTRIVLGLMQGALLFALYPSWTSNSLLAMQPILFVPVVMLVIFLPIIAISSIGHLSRRNLLIWLAALAVLLIGLGAYDVWRIDFSSLLPHSLSPDQACCSDKNSGQPDNFPSLTLFLLTIASLFIGQVMILAGNADGKRIASYPSYFEIAWKLQVQLIFAASFTGLFWLVLQTGNALFLLIKLTFLHTLLTEAWFNIPATTLAFSFALHLSDVRPQIVAGIRKLLLTLFSWLLPIATIIVGAFLLSILATGLAPLWQTGHASHVLLGAVALLIMLINTAYQNGNHLAQKPHRFFLLCTRIACLLLLPLVLLAAYSLGLRVAEYGWTFSRIAGAASALIASMYAIGYTSAALGKGKNLQQISSTNIASSIAILLVLLALLSPLADPARIAVADQLYRLRSGTTSMEHFDFRFLRHGSARYGIEALQRLSQQKDGPYPAGVSEKARKALANEDLWGTRVDTTPDLVNNLRMHPGSQQLLKTFVAQDWQHYEDKWNLPTCMTRVGHQCDVYAVKPDAASAEQLLVFEDHGMPAWFAPSLSGTWQLVGKLMVDRTCVDQLKQAIEHNKLSWLAPLQPDIDLNGVRIHMKVESTMTKCTSGKPEK